MCVWNHHKCDPNSIQVWTRSLPEPVIEVMHSCFERCLKPMSCLVTNPMPSFQERSRSEENTRKLRIERGFSFMNSKMLYVQWNTESIKLTNEMSVRH